MTPLRHFSCLPRFRHLWKPYFLFVRNKRLTVCLFFHKSPARALQDTGDSSRLSTTNVFLSFTLSRFPCFPRSPLPQNLTFGTYSNRSFKLSPPLIPRSLFLYSPYRWSPPRSWTLHPRSFFRYFSIASPEVAFLRPLCCAC